MRDTEARRRLVARFVIEQSEPEWALAFEWDIVLGHDQSQTTALEPLS